MKFKTGQIWVSPRGIYHRVMDTNDFQAKMREGMDGSGRKSFRKIDVPSGWRKISKPTGKNI